MLCGKESPSTRGSTSGAENDIGASHYSTRPELLNNDISCPYHTCARMLMLYRLLHYPFSVNVGYSIFWTTDGNERSVKAFSVCHLIVGQAMISFAMAAFAQSLIASKNMWCVGLVFCM